MSGFDAERFKANERAGFNRIAGRYLAGAAARQALQQALVDLADPAPGECILDIASGPCLLAADATARVGSTGLVVASDIAEAMLACGRDALPPEHLEAMVHCAADAETLPFANDRFDLVTIGLGLFILPDPSAALAEVRRVLVPGGRLALSVWGPADDVPLISHAQACIARLLPPPRVPRPSVFRFGESAVLRGLLTDAGYATVHTAGCRLDCRFTDAADYWQAFLDLAGGAAEAIARLPEAVGLRLADEVVHDLQPCRDGDGYATRNRVLLALAHK